MEDSFTKDELLTNITLYWVTQTIQSANQYYLPRDTPQRLIGPHDRVRVPMGVTLNATQRIEHPPREYIERLYADIRQWVQLPRGGHFIALEEPGLVAESLREFFATLHA